MGRMTGRGLSRCAAMLLEGWTWAPAISISQTAHAVRAIASCSSNHEDGEGSQKMVDQVLLYLSLGGYLLWDERMKEFDHC